MSIDVFSGELSAYTAHRARQHYLEGNVRRIFAYVGPDNTAARNNLRELEAFRRVYPGRIYGWWVNRPDQSKDVDEISDLDDHHELDGWVLNLEAPMQHKPLENVVAGVTALGRPTIASLAGVSPSHTNYDYRTLDRHGVAVDWQAYLDSGEGPDPATAVTELVRSSFTIGGWEYRCRWGKRYGWGRALDQSVPTSPFDAYTVPRSPNATYKTGPREWGVHVLDRRLRRPNGDVAGVLLGRAAYPRVRVTLDVTRGADASRTPAQWKALAASARLPNARKRPVSVYLAEHASDSTIAAIADGAA